jgi:hypothetical protein
LARIGGRQVLCAQGQGHADLDRSWSSRSHNGPSVAVLAARNGGSSGSDRGWLASSVDGAVGAEARPAELFAIVVALVGGGSVAPWAFLNRQSEAASLLRI